MTARARLLEAVADKEWQEFLRELKGTRTAEKLDALEHYYKHRDHDRYNGAHRVMNVDLVDCDMCIQVDNYLKALMRGGQLEPFLDLSYFVHCSKGPWRDTFTTVTVDGNRRRISVIRK